MRQSMIWKNRKGLKLGLFPVLEILAPGLEVLFGARSGGVSKGPYESLNVGMNVGDRVERVKRNRDLLLGAAGIDGKKLARAEQIHGGRVAIARRGAVYREIDGLVTTEKGLALSITTADCYAVLIHSPPDGILGALHVGRNGAAEGIIKRSMTMMNDSFRIDATGSIALIGPGICPECYEIGEEEAKRFPSRYRSHRDGRFRLDLLSFCRDELRRCGIPPDRIFEAGFCTSCNPRLFFSYRRDGGITGRHWMLARIRSTHRHG